MDRHSYLSYVGTYVRHTTHVYPKRTRAPPCQVLLFCLFLALSHQEPRLSSCPLVFCQYDASPTHAPSMFNWGFARFQVVRRARPLTSPTHAHHTTNELPLVGRSGTHRSGSIVPLINRAMPEALARIHDQSDETPPATKTALTTLETWQSPFDSSLLHSVLGQSTQSHPCSRW